MSARWPAGDPHDVARAILADPRFHAAASGPAPKSIWDLLRDAVGALFERFFGALRALTGNDRFTTLLGIAILFAAVIFLALVIVRFARRFAGRVRSPGRAGAPAIALDDDADARTLRARATAAAAQRRFRAAAALLWLSALRALDERGKVRYDPSRTPREWRSIVRDRAFDELANDAVDALFAERGVDEALVERMNAAYERVVSA